MTEFKLHFYSAPSGPRATCTRCIPFSITVECDDEEDASFIGERTQVPGWEFRYVEEVRND